MCSYIIVKTNPTFVKKSKKRKNYELSAEYVILSYMKKKRVLIRKRKAYFRPIHFVVLLVVDACLLAGTVIPQQSNISSAKELLASKQQELNNVKIEYEREQANLEYMKTNDYKLQQGAIKYGWHYSDDIIILD